MIARDVDQAAKRLRAFEVEAWEHFGLAGLAFALALVASQVRPIFGVPLLVGGIASLVLGVLDEERRWTLIDSLVLDRDAYAIPIVRRRAEQAATMQSRRALASSVRVLLNQPDPAARARIEPIAAELEELAVRLEDPQLTLEPDSAVACEQLLVLTEIPRARVVGLLDGFRPTD